jgi:DNA-binding transcriptional LysR family regulator
LSRAIAMLEKHLGKRLFTRTGRTLRLNEHGRSLLDATRDAMRRFEDGLRDILDDGIRGGIAIASAGAGTTAFVVPAIRRLLASHPHVAPAISTPAIERLPQQLRQGSLDIAFCETPPRADDLVTARVGELTRGIYCGVPHPWFHRARVEADELAAAAFVAPGTAGIAASEDGWPLDRPRRVAVAVDQIRVGVEVCCTMPLLAVLPDVLARGREHQLRRLPFDFVGSAEVFVLHRRQLSRRPSAVAALLAAVADHHG